MRHLVLVLLALAVFTGGARWDYSTADGYAAMEGRSALAWCIVSLESRFDPNAVGAAGEIGLAQLHPRGKAPEFAAMGFGDIWSPYAQADYLDWALANGQGYHWTAYWMCR